MKGNIFCRKKLYMAVFLCCMAVSALITGCADTAGDSSQNNRDNSDSSIVSEAPKSDIKKKNINKIENEIEEDAEKLLREKAERIRGSVQELNKNEDGKYYYGYTEGSIKISIDTKGFEDDNHGKYQLLKTYQEDGQVYIAMLHRTEDEKIYGEVYKYIG